MFDFSASQLILFINRFLLTEKPAALREELCRGMKFCCGA